MYPEIPALDWRKVDRALSLPDDGGLQRLADQINAIHPPGQGRPGIVEDHRLIGLAGERAFARLFRIQMDLRILKFGDQRKNFKLVSGLTVDVVTRRPFSNTREPNLVIPMNTRAKANILVLVVWLGVVYEPVFRGFIPEYLAREYGWIERFHEKGVPNLVVGAEWLAPISGLMFLHRPRDPMAEELPADWWQNVAEERELIAYARGPQPPEPEVKPVTEAQLKLW